MRRFGTDGVRGTIGIEPITWQSLSALALALGHYMNRKGMRRISIARDTRSSGLKISMLFSQTLRSMGIDVDDCEILPTGVLAWMTVHSSSDVGLMITASHNPATDNGIKLLDAKGSKWSEVAEKELLALWSEPPELLWTHAYGQYQTVNGYDPYLESLDAQFPALLQEMTVVVDAANGAACPFIVSFLEKKGCKVIALNNTPSGSNINENAHLQLENLKRTVLEQGADIGVALDGDADRLFVVDDAGRLWDGDALLYLLVRADLDLGIRHPGVVITHLGNEGLVRSLAALEVLTHRSDVGDKYVARALLALDWQLGGEPCGHMVDRRSSNVSDPFAIMMRVIAWIKHSNLPLSQAPRPEIDSQRTATVSQSSDNASDVLAHAVKTYPEIRWVIRSSGTEPVLRLMGEYANAAVLDAAFEEILLYAKNCIV